MIELNDEVKRILGTPCFACAGQAQILRLMGHEIKTKAEDEQAAVLHWNMCMYEKHGDNWRKKAGEVMKKAVDNAKTENA